MEVLLKKSQSANSRIGSCGWGERVPFVRVKMNCGLSKEATLSNASLMVRLLPGAKRAR